MTLIFNLFGSRYIQIPTAGVEAKFFTGNGQRSFQVIHLVSSTLSLSSLGLQIQKCTRVQMTSEGFTELSLKCTVFYSLEELDDVGLAVRRGEIDLFATSE